MKLWIRLLGLLCAFLILRSIFERLCFHQESISFSEECISLALEHSGAVTQPNGFRDPKLGSRGCLKRPLTSGWKVARLENVLSVIA